MWHDSRNCRSHRCILDMCKSYALRTIITVEECRNDGHTEMSRLMKKQTWPEIMFTLSKFPPPKQCKTRECTKMISFGTTLTLNLGSDPVNLLEDGSNEMKGGRQKVLWTPKKWEVTKEQREGGVTRSQFCLSWTLSGRRIVAHSTCVIAWTARANVEDTEKDTRSV